MHVVDSNAFHRTITHSIIFFVILSPLMGYLIHRIHKGQPVTRKDWTWLAFWALFTHALLDAFTTWGTALFWPSSYKVALQSIFVIDPLYTLPLLLFTTLAIIRKRNDQKRSRLNYTGLILSSVYLVSTLFVKWHVNQVFYESLIAQEIDYERMETRPAPLNTILWGATIETEEGYYIGYYSLLDATTNIDFHFYPKNHSLLDNFKDSRLTGELVEMSNGWYTLNREGDDQVLFNDLRFGTNRAWEAGGQFIFSYVIEKETYGEVEIWQRDRSFDDEPSVIMSKLFSRIKGNKNP